MKPASDAAELLDALPATHPVTDGGGAALAPAAKSRAVDFYELTKPRMNFLVVTTTAVGYYAAVHGDTGWLRLLHTLLGTVLCAASAAVLNQWWEREYDVLMPRTRNRPLPAGRLQPGEALWFGAVLGVAGVAYLLLFVNALTAGLGLFTMLSYVLVYTPMKRHSTLNTIVGAVPGAIPPVMGWTAVTGELSAGAVALFAILFLWQMPHFLAIAILYRRDYAAGGFQMLPVVDEELHTTGRMIVLYGMVLVPVSMLPSLVGVAGAAYAVTAVLLSLAYLSFGVSCAVTKTRADARKLFFASIIYLPLLLAAVMLDKR